MIISIPTGRTPVQFPPTVNFLFIVRSLWRSIQTDCVEQETNSIFEIYTNGKWSNQSKSLIWASFPFLLYFQDWESDKFYEVGCNDTIVLILCSWWRLNLCIKPQYKKKCDRIICRNWNIILMVVHCRNSQLRRTSLI